MANLNQRIDPVRRRNIPDLHRGVNETIDKVNWLMGLRVNGGQISEGGRGPIIDIPTATAAGAGPTPWATDPDGNSASWQLATFIDTSTGNYFDAWVWAGGTKNVRPVPWLTDPSDIIANWVVCADNTFWGTGNCPAGVGNFQSVHFVFNGPNGVSPAIYTGNVLTPPITPPKSPPVLYFLIPFSASVPTDKPYLTMATGASPTNPIVSVSFTFTITYDGTQIYSLNGSGTGNYNINQGTISIALDPTNWQYDPGGLPGYSHGSKEWISQYNGPISSNTNPTIVQTFTYSISPVGILASLVSWNVNLLTA